MLFFFFSCSRWALAKSCKSCKFCRLRREGGDSCLHSILGIGWGIVHGITVVDEIIYKIYKISRSRRIVAMWHGISVEDDIIYKIYKIS